MTILKTNAPEWKELFVGCIGAGLWGSYPFLYGIAFGKIYEVSSVIRNFCALKKLKHFFIKESGLRASKSDLRAFKGF